MNFQFPKMSDLNGGRRRRRDGASSSIESLLSSLYYLFSPARKITPVCLNSYIAPYTHSQTRPKLSSSTIFKENSPYWPNTHILPSQFYSANSLPSYNSYYCCTRQCLHSAACFCAMARSKSLLICSRPTSAVSRWSGLIPASNATIFKIRSHATLNQSKPWWPKLSLSSDVWPRVTLSTTECLLNRQETSQLSCARLKMRFGMKETQSTLKNPNGSII